MAKVAFEVVRSDADENGQEWWGRKMRGKKITWTTERMKRKVGVERSIVQMAQDLLPTGTAALVHESVVDWGDHFPHALVVYTHGVRQVVEVRYVDLRGQ